ncbi:hypothetical protein CW959_001648 [Salmonella enterica subsp. enterica serovar Mbandaka]|nr:hypothetical protein [Salmonella enterica subsp. enterica serovar Mbandaka]EDU8579622.1 hypothetical protein [Salmonella enterica subsp. enterica serovar Mbandaka]
MLPRMDGGAVSPLMAPLEHPATGVLRLQPKRLCLAMALALGSQAALAQTALPSSSALATTTATSEENSSHENPGSAAIMLDTVTVTGTAEEQEKKIGNTAGASKEDVERRGASHMSDLIDQISGTSVNSLYARPEISVGVQGIAGHGRVSQSLEGINQNFHAFTRDIGQTGSIFVTPQFLRSIDVTRGGSTGTGALGSLGSSVDFRYLDLDDILRPGKSFGGMIRGSTGFSKYRNGEKPSGSFFLGGRNERWEVMLGATDSENEGYRIGSNFNKSDMLRDLHATTMNMFVETDRYGPIQSIAQGYTNCRWQAAGMGGLGSAMNNCQMNEQQLGWLKQAAKEPLKGTEKENDAQMLRVRHYFNDAYDQKLELFATAATAKYTTDLEPSLLVPVLTQPGADARWEGYKWGIGSELKNQVASLKYSGHFSDWLNPEIQFYHESQDRKQRWQGYPGTISQGEALHYFVDVASTGVKLNNASHFMTDLTGPLRFDVGLDMRRAKKRVDSLADAEWYEQYMHSLGSTNYKAETWDPDSDTNAMGLALSLSTEGSGPWQASGGIGYQRVKLDVKDTYYSAGNVKQAGTMYGASYWRPIFRAQGYSTATAQRMALAAAAEELAKFQFDTNGQFGTYTKQDSPKHDFDLKSANFSLQYTHPGTGLTTYGIIGYNERAPTSNEMYMSGSWHKTGFMANPDLEPEKNLSLQLGMNYEQKNWLAASDRLNVGVNFYFNRIRNYIVYGPMFAKNQVFDLSQMSGMVGNVNNVNPFIRKGLELDFSYQQALFYLRGNVTVPIRHDNKVCSMRTPGGQLYSSTANADGTTTFTSFNDTERLCYSGWNWMEAGTIEPIRGSLTAALTPYGGKLEIGSTLHYRGKQRAAYWYDPAVNPNRPDMPQESGFITASLWPKMIKVDLFANYRVNDQLKLGVYIANLTDEMDGSTTSLGYNFYPGRTVTANLEYRF